MKIVDYCIVISHYERGGDWEDFPKRILALVAEGWEPLGGVSMIRETHHMYGDDYDITRFAQAMVKKEDNGGGK